jgi:hypothetical protein
MFVDDRTDKPKVHVALTDWHDGRGIFVGDLALVLKIRPVVNGLARDPHDLARHEHDPAR